MTNNVRMEEYFYFRNHLCITFELLSINLYEFMKNSNFTSMSLSLIRRSGATPRHATSRAHTTSGSVRSRATARPLRHRGRAGRGEGGAGSGHRRLAGFDDTVLL